MEHDISIHCKVGQGEACCRYIGSGITGIVCMKLVPDLKAKCDYKVATGQFTAKGDNCEGEKM